MNKFNLIFSVCLLYQIEAFSTTVCELLKIPLPTNSTISAVEYKNYHKKLENECELMKLYDLVEGKARKFNTTLTKISMYQALRYMRSDHYFSAAENEVPVPYVYQRKKEHYKLPINQRSTEIWRNFESGISQLEPALSALRAGQELDLNELLKIHKGFYQFSLEDGDYSHLPNPGLLKRETGLDNPWWPLKSQDEARQLQFTFDKMNARYRDLGLLTPFDSKGSSMTDEVVTIQNTPSGPAVFSSNSLTVHNRTVKILEFMNTMLSQGVKGQHMIWKNEIMTPGQVAYLVQQFFVAIHPFDEGNGRVSRFLQELVLRTFGLPHGASGELPKFDTTELNDEYYKIAINKNFELLNKVNNCFDKVYPQSYPLNFNLENEDQSQFSYQCRILKRSL